MAKRELTDIEKNAHKKLRAIWNSKRKDLGLTQESVALACGWSGQTAFAQYINANTPLNIEAVLRISKVLNVHPTEIMPEIADILP
jgi:transcriptional regulator with XRE-family HTH domain